MLKKQVPFDINKMFSIHHLENSQLTDRQMVILTEEHLEYAVFIGGYNLCCPMWTFIK